MESRHSLSSNDPEEAEIDASESLSFGLSAFYCFSTKEA